MSPVAYFKIEDEVFICAVAEFVLSRDLKARIQAARIQSAEVPVQKLIESVITTEPTLLDTLTKATVTALCRYQERDDIPEEVVKKFIEEQLEQVQEFNSAYKKAKPQRKHSCPCTLL